MPFETARERAALARVLDNDRSKFNLSLPRPGELRVGWFTWRSYVAGVSSSIASSYALLHRLTVANIYLATANKTNMPHFDSYHLDTTHLFVPELSLMPIIHGQS